MITAIVIALILLAFFGAPIFAILGAIAVLGATLTQPDASISQAFAGALVRVFHMATSAEGTTLATIPLFTFMGYVLAESKTADRIVAFANAILGWVPGGLAIVTIGVCALFTTVTGASGVTIVAVGGLVMPALLKQGYKRRFSLGLVTGTGSIGLLFPPSLPLIIFGIIYGITAQAAASGGGDTLQLVDFDVSKFLLAGIPAGVLLTSAVGIYAMVIAIRDKVPRTRFNWSELGRTTIKAIPELLIPVVMIVLLAVFGFQVPDAAAVTALYVVLLEVVLFRDVKIRALPRVARESLQLVGAIFILIIAATALTDYFVYAHIPDRTTEWMVEHIHSKYVFLIALNVMLLVVGFLMDIFTALLVVVPLIAPAATGFGVDPYHLGIIFLLNLEIGYVHPPVGLNLFISAFRFKVPMTELYWAIVPYLIIMLVCLGIVTYVPAIVPVTSKKTTESSEPPSTALREPGPSADAGVVLIPNGDGGTWTIAHCENPEIKGDSLAYADCQAMFKLWPKCDSLAQELDRMECRDTVLSGGDPFEAKDGGP